MAKTKKLSKKQKKEQPIVKLIRKSNDLVEARYKFDIWETRVFTKMLTMIKLSDEDFKEYRIYLKEIIDEFSLSKDNRAYERLKIAGQKLNNKNVKIYSDTDEGLKQFDTKIVAGVESFVNDEDGKYIDISFHPRMKEHLLALKKKFTTYDARNILKLPSSYSIRIYELLKQYEKIGKRKFDLIELKEMIGALEEVKEGAKKTILDSYPLYGNFRQKVLLKAQRDLEKWTDIAFTFEPIKKGRKTVAVLFYIHTNKPDRIKKNKMALPILEKTQLTNTSVKQVDHEAVPELYSKVQKWFSINGFRKLLETYPEEQLSKAITYTINRIAQGNKIENVAGYIIATAKQPNLFDPFEEQKTNALEKRKNRETAALYKSTMEQQLKDIRTVWYQEQSRLIDDYLFENPDQKEEIFILAQKKPFAKYDFDKSGEENYISNKMFRMSVHSAVKENHPEVVAILQSKYEPKVKQLEKELRSL